MPKNLTALLSPRSIAVVGASRSPEKVGSVLLKNIIDSKFTGKLFVINPNADKINGVPCFSDVASLPEVVDLVIIAVPAAKVMDLMQQIAQKGIKNVVIISAGFKESGPEGIALEKQLAEIASKNDINILGPNCLGFVNKNCSLNATFGKVSSLNGNLRFISQSGAIATSLFDWFESVDLGFSDFITIGNKASLDETDFLEYFLESSKKELTTLAENGMSKVKPIGLYLESITNGEQFIKVAKEITAHDPIFIIKPGKHAEAISAMQSHTGAIAGADDVLEVALEKAGIIRCNTLENFFDLSKAFSWENIPAGPRVAIVSNAGGPAVISADAVVSEGLEMADFDAQTKEKLAKILPRSASVLGPIDVLGDALADKFGAAAEVILQTNSCDALLVILTPQIMTQIEKTAELIGELSKKYNKPIFCSFIGGTLVNAGEKVLNKYRIPSFRFPERAIATIASMWKFRKQQIKNSQTLVDIQVLNTQMLPENVNKIIETAVKNNQAALDNIDANEVIKGAGIQTPATQIAKNLAEAIAVAESFGYPVVLKLSSPGLLHKKHVGGVILDIRDAQQLDTAWATLTRKVENLEVNIKNHVQFQVQKEVPNGVEIIVGVKKDPTFGPVILFGAGGSMAELIADKNLQLLPMDLSGAKELVKRSKVYELLQESPTDPPYALDKLYQLLVNLANVAKACSEIQEIEINPVIVTLNDVSAVDSKVILAPNKPKPVGPKFKVATVLAAQNVAGKIHYFECESEAPLAVTPGHYISIKVSSTRINCYSVAGQNSPNHFNLLIDSTPGGPGSKFFEQIKVGDKLTYLGPFGTFSLKEDDGANTLLFLATGSGYAPLKFMIEDLLENKKTSKKVAVYIGVNNSSDVYMQSYFDNLHTKYPNFTYKFAVLNKAEDWRGPTGYITPHVKQDFSDASGCAAYMCGNKFMIADCTKVLLENGCSPERIYHEKYE